MSLARITLLIVQAACNQQACTPPNPTPSKGRYHTDELYILQIAPLIFKIHQCTLWFCTMFEILYYLSTIVPSYLPLPIPTTSLVCPIAPPNAVHLTPLFVIGVFAVALGAYIRIDCFYTLGKLFTFDLTVNSDHKLVTSRFYGYVRHPAYTGSLLLIAGLTFSHLTSGSWLTACGPLRNPALAFVVSTLWWIWSLCVVFSRADAEDKMMQKLFKSEWETYAVQVPWWLFPGLI
ncbi:hypothetical protein L208DRAFT_1251306 [Tricholoma matsutake]|nr:hypothetical protein L208DRAFT_1251306 [Tricholoma matsutake 945]